MIRDCLGPDPCPRTPLYRAPPGATDCHAHVFGPSALFPFIADRSFTPPDASVTDYLHMLDAIGIERAVLVQGSVHGADNRAVAAAVESARSRLRGVAIIRPDTSERDVRRLHELGFRGARLSTVVKGTPGFDLLEAVAAKVKPFGWHLVVHVDRSQELADLAERLAETGCPLVVDHIARIRLGEGLASPGFHALARLLEAGNCWVKISGQHRMSKMGFPWSDMEPLVRAVVRLRPDRVLWGTDWPHPNQYDDMQNDGDLLDAFSKWVPDEALRRRILVTNPSILYGF